MLFNSFPFILLFLPITLVGYYYLLRMRIILGAKVWLVAASLLFYSQWNIYYLPLILLSMAFNFALGAVLPPPPRKREV